MLLFYRGKFSPTWGGGSGEGGSGEGGSRGGTGDREKKRGKLDTGNEKREILSL